MMECFSEKSLNDIEKMIVILKRVNNCHKIYQKLLVLKENTVIRNHKFSFLAYDIDPEKFLIHLEKEINEMIKLIEE